MKYIFITIEYYSIYYILFINILIQNIKLRLRIIFIYKKEKIKKLLFKFK